MIFGVFTLLCTCIVLVLLMPTVFVFDLQILDTINTILSRKYSSSSIVLFTMRMRLKSHNIGILEGAPQCMRQT